MRRLRARVLTLVAADLAGGLTIAVLVSPSLRFAYRSPTLHATIETACGFIALLAAFLVFGRYRATERTDDLVLTTALGFLASANLVFSAMPWALLSAGSLRFSAWTSLLGTLFGSALLALSAFLPSRQLWNPRRAAAIVLGSAAALYALCAILVGVFQGRLPLGFAPTTQLPAAGIPRPVGAHPLLSVELACTILLAVAAVGFAWRGDRTGDDFMKWLAPSAALAAIARGNYSLFPSLYTQWVYVGDAPRFGAYLLLLGGAVREIGRYQRRMAEFAALDERRRIARELHDGVAQELAFVAAQARLLARRPSAVEIKYLATAAERALAESRRAIAVLAHPAEESLDAALVATVEELTSRNGSSARFLVEPDVMVPPQTRETLLRIVREAVTNAHRHGHASQITVELSNSSGVRLRIADDGEGFDLAKVDDSSGFGLASMRARTRSLGGVLWVESRPTHGTTVEVVLP
jgi:signal transduction histidine kinase